jgi:tryptophan synthase alpha chain
MNRISEKFKELNFKAEGAFIPFVTLGDPSYDATIKLIRMLAENGADILELGIPFSDPVADGPTIQASYDRALLNGMNTDRAFEIVRKARLFTSLPIVFLTYYNLVLQRGIEKFFKDSAGAGVDGIVIPDLPVEESDLVVKISEKYGIAVIFLVAPTTSGSRLKKILEKARGFIYLVSVLGTTGARSNLSKITHTTISKIVKYTRGKIPVAVGFGISKPQHVKQVLEKGADGVIVGSAIIDLYAKNLESKSELENSFLKIGDFIREMKSATRNLCFNRRDLNEN